MYTVYMHRFPNGKVYIGTTGMKPEKRWGKNGILYSSKAMKSAINEFGWDNVEHTILFENLSRKDAEIKEIEMIKKYRSCENDKGYNVLERSNTPVHSEETKAKMSQTRKGVSPSEAHRRALSESNKNKIIPPEVRKKFGDAHRGKKLTEEHKRHIGESCKGKNVVPVRMLSKEGCVLKEFKSIQEASKYVNGTDSNISMCCKGIRPFAKGYKWEYVQRKSALNK